MNEELYHHGVLGMKWGVRHTELGYLEKRTHSSGSSGSYGTKQKPINYRKAGNISNSAKALGLGRNTLYRKIEKYGILNGAEMDFVDKRPETITIKHKQNLKG